MKAFKNFAWLTTVMTYLLIFIGGLVRVSGAGLGCPDWPKCFGRWIPPTNISQLPPDIDPSMFNFTLAWIEYINRLFGMTVGLLIAALAIWAILKFRNNRKILIPSILSALLVAFQGWQGSQVVSSGLKPFIITIHMSLAFIIVSLVLYVFLQSYLELKPSLRIPVSSRIKYGLFALYLLSIFQIAIGTQIRSQIELIQKNTPLMPTSDVLSLVGFVTPLHIVIGFVLLIVAIYLQTHFRMQINFIPPVINELTIAIIGSFVLQVVVGLGVIWFDLPALGRVFHLWISSILIGLLLSIFVFVERKEKKS